MKGAGIAMATSDKMPKEKPNVRFHFPKGGGVQPEGFKNLYADADVTVITKGRLSGFSSKESPWDDGTGFTVEMKSCEVQCKQKGVSLDDALAAAKKVGEA